MKKTFLAGLATLLPIAITLIIVIFIVDVLTAPFVGLVEDTITYYGGAIATHHRYTLIIFSRILVLIILFFTILILGFVGRRFFFSFFIKLTDRIMKKIPFVKTIYSISIDVTKNVFSDENKKLFKGTAVVPFPKENTYVLGLIAGNPPDAAQQKHDKKLQSIFVPTAPHPISGFLMMFSEDEIKQVDIETEDVFKFLLSCGMFEPGETGKNET